MTKTFDPAATALSAIENASQVHVRRSDLKNVLETGSGEPSHVRALFSDVDLSILMRLLIEFGISDESFARAYARARERHAAANMQLDEWLEDFSRQAVPTAG